MADEPIYSILSSPMCAKVGDIVKIEMSLRPENGYVPESLFDTQGVVTFALGWGNYLPGVHELIEGCRSGEFVENVSVDAGWGSRRQDLLFQVPLQNLSKIISKNNAVRVGNTLKLTKDLEVLVKEVRESDSIVVLDANPPLAGTSYSCSFRVLEITPIPDELYAYHTPGDSRFEIATFGLGCFWGAELAFARLPGVVATQVGYSQGITDNPTYEEVCEGATQHREVVMVVFDTQLVSYRELLEVGMERLDQTTSSLELHRLFQTPSETRQYKYGFYYHTESQRRDGQEFLQTTGNRFGVELLQASRFFKAEEYHQQYLYKGGQSIRKGSKETIRCFG